MPLRMAHYDIELYMRQMRETGRRRRRKGEKQRRVNGRKQPFTSDFGPGDKVTLVVSMVVYYGDEPWDAPTELAELYPEIPEEIAEYVKPLLPSYKMKIVSPQNQDAELDMLGPGLRAVLYYARHAHDAAGLQRMLEEHPELRTPVPLAASLISSLMRRKQIVKNKEENVNMWTVLEDAKRIGRDEGRAEGRVEGRAEGRVEGRAEGRAEGEAEVVCSMYRNGMKISEISKYTNISIAHLRRIVASQKA